jgi:large-conductance mechanosensitive channel
VVLATFLGALINLNGNGHYIHWGFFQMSVANFVVIVLMIVVFVLAILLPFPRRKRDDQ